MSSITELSERLTDRSSHQWTLTSLLQLSAQGCDVSPVAERVVQYCLFTPSGTTTDVLSLSLDVLIASPSHAYWVDILSVILENLRRSGTRACLIALQKIPTLPHSALQHLVLYSSTVLIACISDDSSASIRSAAVKALASIALRDRPLTAPSTDATRLEEIVDEKHLSVIRHAVERLLFALLEALFDSSDAVAVPALTYLTSYSHSASLLSEYAPLNATKHATGQAIWHILTASLSPLSKRFSSIFTSAPSSKSSSSKSLPQSRYLKDAISSFARMGCHVLSSTPNTTNDSDVPDDNLEAAHQRAATWVNNVLLPLSSHSNVELATTASVSLLDVCSYAADNPSAEKVTSWGVHAVRNIIRVLTLEDAPIPAIAASNLVRHAAYAVAALSKSDFVKTQFIVSSVVSLLPYAATCPGRHRRLEILTLLASTVIEYDLSGKDTSATGLKGVLKSSSWRSILDEAKTDSMLSAELICCFGVTSLEASKKIIKCTDENMRLNLVHSWGIMLCQFMHGSIECLRWSYSPASVYAKEVFLKVFTAAGQYSSFLMRSQNISLEEYERIQELLVTAASEQKDISVRATLLANITKYWLASGLKAQSNAERILKAIWKHLQEHYKDEDIFKNELKTGVLWSKAKQGEKMSPSESGGYISFTTRVTKQTRAMLNTVSSTVSSAIENRLVGSIALATAAAEGSTLTTDFVYSGITALMALIGHVPELATKGVSILNKYMDVMLQAESADFIASEAVRNSITVIATYEGDHFPRPIVTRDLTNIIGPARARDVLGGLGMLSWLEEVTNTCVHASSRLEDPAKDYATISSEEEVIRACSMSARKLVPFCPTTLSEPQAEVRDLEEGDSQVLNGCSDPFSVVASHSMDTVKGLVRLRIHIVNKSSFLAGHVVLRFLASGSVFPLPDTPPSFSLGSMAPSVGVPHTLTLGVQSNHSFSGKVLFSIGVRRANASNEYTEQSMLPYYIPSADVLLLRRPAVIAGVDVFRRRWDAMRESVSFHVFLRKDQSVDLLVDLLERKSKCLKSVGRMRTHSHVCTMVADSSRGNYVAVVAVAPEAKETVGIGPCLVYMTIRSNSMGYSVAFRSECREWLGNKFHVIISDEGVSEEDKALALRPQDAFFITDINSELSPYQRWRTAHAIRMTL